MTPVNRSRSTRLSSPAVCLLFSMIVVTWWPTKSAATWIENGNPICTETEQQRYPKICSDGNGGAFVMWTDSRSFPSDAYGQHVDSQGAPLWAPGGVRIAVSVGERLVTDLIPDGLSGALVIFTSDTWTTGERSIVRAQRIDAQGNRQWTQDGLSVVATTWGILDNPLAGPTAMRDGAPDVGLPLGYYVAMAYEYQFNTWHVGVRRISSDGGYLSLGVSVAGGLLPKVQATMTSDGVGSPLNPKGAVLAWQQGAFPTPKVYAARVSPSCTPLWGGSGIPVCPASGAQVDPRIENVGGDKVVVVWSDRRTDDGDIYAQKLDSTGSALWAPNGIPICNVSNLQDKPRIVPDGLGGALILWVDFRSSDWILYGQRIDPNGAPLWAPSGIPFSSVGGVMAYSAATDGAGGVVVAWESGLQNGDIYAQRVNGAGNLLWGPEGRLICDAPDTQWDLSLRSDGSNGALIAWHDWRSDLGDIYATRSFGTSVVDVPVLPVVQTRVVFALSSANPTRDGARFDLTLPRDEVVSLDVFDVAGHRIASLAPQAYSLGAHSIGWDGGLQNGTFAAPGTYFVRLNVGQETHTERIVVVR